MAIVHMDNFSIYGSDKSFMLNGVYAENGGVTIASDPDGVSSGQVLEIGTGAGAGVTRGFRFVLPSLQDRVGICGRIWFPALPTGSNGTPTPMIWRDINNDALFAWTVDSTGRISARLGDWNGSI